jgi:hypothetical protein
MAYDAATPMQTPNMPQAAKSPPPQYPQGATMPQGRDYQQGEGGGYLTRQQCAAIYDIGARVLPPEELSELESMLRAMLNPAEDRSQDVAADAPPPFKGMPQPGGKLVGDSALARAGFESRYPGVIGRIKIDTMGIQAPQRPSQKEVARLSTDSANRHGVESGASGFFSRFPGAKRIGHC